MKEGLTGKVSFKECGQRRNDCWKSEQKSEFD